MDALGDWLRQFLSGDSIRLMLIVVLPVGLLELLVPARKVPIRHYAFNIAYSVVTFAIGTALLPLVAGTLGVLLRKLGFGLIDLRPLGFDGIGGAVVATLLSAVVFDFFFYWMHRLEHRSKILWQEHLVHHTDEHLNVTSGSRSHFLDTFLLPAFVTLPMAVLFKLPPISIAALWSVPFAWTYFVHANLKLGFGPLWWLLVSPNYHRLHHSLEPEHIDKNFATWFPVWDILFGTLVRPTRGRSPATGVVGVSLGSLPRGVAFPFIAWGGMIRSRLFRPGLATQATQPSARKRVRRN